MVPDELIFPLAVMWVTKRDPETPIFPAVPSKGVRLSTFILLIVFFVYYKYNIILKGYIIFSKKLSKLIILKFPPAPTV